MRNRMALISSTLILCAGIFAAQANAQQAAAGSAASYQDHFEAATLLAAQDMAGRNLYDCKTPPVSAAPTGTPLIAPPTRVFDQLYYVGSNIVGAWALTTSAGIIQIDTMNNTDDAQNVILAAYKKLGLDPTQIKYVLLTHGHPDHFGGAKYIQDTYHPHVLMSAIDWDMVAEGAKDPKVVAAPKRDLDITDGQKLTLGDTTLTFYVTPGHTPGTVSFLVPVTDHGQKHLLSFWGGSAMPRTLEPLVNGGRSDAGLLAYKQSFSRFFKIGEDNGADGFIANHPYRDLTFVDGKDDKITKNAARKPGDPSPWIGRSEYIRYMMISLECLEGQIAWIQAGKPQASSKADNSR
jgi:metallo-beta-lactamase class B